MSRIIHTQGTPATQRNRLRRTIAEALYILKGKRDFDPEARDLVALVVFALREIASNIDSSATAWEKRDYYMKAERLRREWEWIGPMQRLLTGSLIAEQWGELPSLLTQLRPHFDDLTINKLTRNNRLWEGAYERLRASEQSPSAP